MTPETRALAERIVARGVFTDSGCLTIGWPKGHGITEDQVEALATALLADEGLVAELERENQLAWNTCEAAEAKAAELERREKQLVSEVEHLWPRVKTLESQATAATQRIEGLEAALRTFGKHKPSCARQGIGGAVERPCSCGLDAALTPPAAPGETL